MSGPTSSALILVLLGLISADATPAPPVPHAPVPQVTETVSAVDQAGSEIARLKESIRNGLNRAEPTSPPPVSEPATTTPAEPLTPSAETSARPQPSESSQPNESTQPSAGPTPTQTATPRFTPDEQAARVVLKPLDTTYQRLAPAEISAQAKAQVEALKNAHQPKASGKDGVPVDWLPRETRKALGGNGPRDVKMLAATQEFAWYTWAEADAAWVARIDLADLTKVQAGPLPAAGAFEVPGLQRLIDIPGQPLTVKDVKGNPIPIISR